MSFDAFMSADADAAGKQTDDLDPPADGTYEAALIDGEFFTAKSGKTFVKLHWRVASAQQTGYEWKVLLGFKSQEQANMTKAQVRELGIEVDALGSADELNDALKAKVGGYFAIEVSTNGTFRNSYVRGPVNGSDVPIDPEAFEPEPAGAQATADEEVPF